MGFRDKFESGGQIVRDLAYGMAGADAIGAHKFDIDSLCQASFK